MCTKFYYTGILVFRLHQTNGLNGQAGTKPTPNLQHILVQVGPKYFNFLAYDYSIFIDEDHQAHLTDDIAA